jgi:pimeloyl-ACP methyl ester carboxylesterase
LNYLHDNPADLGDGVGFDLSKVVMCGHGFGGCTALAASEKEDTRITHTMLLDPWLLCLVRRIYEEGLSIKQPLLAINSEEYHPNVVAFDSYETIHTLFNNNNAEDDLNVMIKETGHLF